MPNASDINKDILPSRLNQLCASYDRTADMGLFPHDRSARPLDMTARGADAMSIADDKGRDLADRDQAIWSLVYRENPQSRRQELPDLLYSIATSAREDVLRRSSSWALFKLGDVKLLTQCLRSDDSGNVNSWKQHLIYESQGRTDWIDPRPIRAVDSKFGYGVTLPLTIHGIVMFRTKKSDRKSRAQTARSMYAANAGSSSWAAAAQGVATLPAPSAQREGYGSAAKASSSILPPDAYDWHSLPVGPISQRLLVGDLTAAVVPGSSYDNLIIQKVCANPFDAGFDHVQGYLFRGMSRSLGGNAMAHYYTSRGLQPLYLSDVIGDASEGVIDVETQLTRHAETHIATNNAVGYPYVQSVRGLFFGPARMNTIVASDPDAPLDNLLQIVRDPYANGWFFGEFRSVPVDVDGDGQIEINGMEMFTDTEGHVVARAPVGPQPSLSFAR